MTVTPSYSEQLNYDCLWRHLIVNHWTVSDCGAILTWSAGDDLKDEEEEDGDSSPVRLPSSHYEVYYKSVGDNSTSASVFESDKVTL